MSLNALSLGERIRLAARLAAIEHIAREIDDICDTAGEDADEEPPASHKIQPPQALLARRGAA